MQPVHDNTEPVQPVHYVQERERCVLIALLRRCPSKGGIRTRRDAISLPALPFFRSYNEVFVHTAFIPYYLSTDDIDFVCVLCTSSSTAAVASLSLPLTLSVFFQGYLTQQYRHFSTYPFIFSQLRRSVCTKCIHSLLPFWHVLFFDL